MEIKIVGKWLKHGISGKTGKFVSGCVIYVLYKEPGVNGYATKSYWINSSVCLPQDIKIGKKYFIEEQKYVTRLELIA